MHQLLFVRGTPLRPRAVFSLRRRRTRRSRSSANTGPAQGRRLYTEELGSELWFSGPEVNSRHLTPRGPRRVLNAAVLKAWQPSAMPVGPFRSGLGEPASDMLLAHVAHGLVHRGVGVSPAGPLSPVPIVSRVKSRECRVERRRAQSWAKAWLCRRFRFTCPFSLVHNSRFRKLPSHPGRSDFPSPVGGSSCFP